MARGSSSELETIGAQLLATAEIEFNGPNPWDPQVHDKRFFARALRDRELGLGEAYQEGWFDVERLDQMLSRIVLADIKSQIKLSPQLLKVAASQVLRNRQTVKRASINASAHYDIGNDLFERMLDKRMIYSCAYWRWADNLDAAQEAKLDLICRKLHLEPGMALLDIGCGWGGLAHFAATRYGATVTGISPAIEQIKIASQRCEGLDVSIEQADYRSMTGSFDRIVSVGMMEHVGTKNLAHFFERCDELLVDDGLMLHHTIGSNDSTDRSDAWFDKYIFPGGVLPSLGQIAEAAQPTFTIEDVHNFGPDYDRTLMAWSERAEQAWPDLPHYGEHFRRTWHYYLMASAAGFRTRNTQLWQVVFSRVHRPSGVYTATR